MARPAGLPIRICARAFGALVFAGLGACSRPAASGGEEEALPASPCSVNGMLFRDTPDQNFEQCGESELPLRGEVAECAKQAMAAAKPFVVPLEGGGLAGVLHTPALAGARFDEGYAVRMYIPEGRGRGHRIPTDVVMMQMGGELSVMPSIGGEMRCIESSDAPPAAPAAEAKGWVDLPPTGKHRAHPGRCEEWFDAAAFAEQPWDSRYDASAVFRCDRN